MNAVRYCFSGVQEPFYFSLICLILHMYYYIAVIARILLCVLLYCTCIIACVERGHLSLTMLCVEILDGADVTDTARQFLRNWQASKEAVKQKREISSHTSDKLRM